MELYIKDNISDITYVSEIIPPAFLRKQEGGIKFAPPSRILRDKRRGSFKMETIKDIIPDVIQGLRAKKRSRDEPEALLRWVLPKKELGHVKFRYLRNGVLGITVDSSAWIYQLNLQKPKLLAKLGKKSKAIKDIRFYIGETQ